MIELVLKDKSIYATCRFRSSDEVVLNPGFYWVRCKNPKKEFALEPEMQTILKQVENASQTPEGSDNPICTSHIICSGFDSLNGKHWDAQDVAASIVHGKPMSGNLAWVLDNDERTLLKKHVETLAPPVPEIHQELKDEYQKMINAVMARFDPMQTELLRVKLSHMHHFHKKLGGKSQFRFIVPHLMDNEMRDFGFECVETDGYDLSLTGGYPRPVLLSSKMGVEQFQTESGKYHRARGSKIDRTKSIMLSNSYVSTTSDAHKKPLFDLMIVFQHTPFLGCGLVPYPSLTIVKKPAGNICEGIPISEFTWIVNPEEKVIPYALTPEEEQRMDEEVERCKAPAIYKPFAENINS